MKIKLNILILMVIFTGLRPIYASGSLWNYLSNSYVDPSVYVAPSIGNLTTAENLFKTLLMNRVVNISDIDSWKTLGFNLISLQEGDEIFAIVKEINPAGHGFYIIRLTGEFTENILEAPHRPSDLYTHEIAYKLLLEGNFLACAINTTHRNNIDIAKEPMSYYNAFTRAVASSFSMPKLLQLHAFDAPGHEINADLILSSTKKETNAIYDQIAMCLKHNLIESGKAFTILQYPKDVIELGGSQNINAKNFYQINPRGLFFHIETSKSLRDAMRISSDLRAAFYKCFIGGM